LAVTFARKISFVIALAGVVTFCLCVSAQEMPGQVVLVVITTPSGPGGEAELARSLIPIENNDNYKLQTIDQFDEGIAENAAKAREQQIAPVVARAQEAALAFDLVRAARLRRQIADDLLQTELVALASTKVATYLLAAGAASVDAGEEDLAGAYFRRALAVDSAVTPGPQISPEAKLVFDAARVLGPAHIGPAPSAVMHSISRDLKADGVLWIAVGNDQSGIVVTERLLLTANEDSAPETSHHPPGNASELANWAPQERNRLASFLAHEFPGELKKDEKKPWYKKWWVYAVAGGVIAAGAVAGVLIADSLETPQADVVVHY
jgi:hypothetical protein